MLKNGRCESCGGSLRAPLRDASDEDVAVLSRFCSVHCYHYGGLAAATEADDGTGGLP